MSKWNCPHLHPVFCQMIKDEKENNKDPKKYTYFGHSLNILALGSSMLLLRTEVTNKSLSEGDDGLKFGKTC